MYCNISTLVLKIGVPGPDPGKPKCKKWGTFIVDDCLTGLDWTGARTVLIEALEKIYRDF